MVLERKKKPDGDTPKQEMSEVRLESYSALVPTKKVAMYYTTYPSNS